MQNPNSNVQKLKGNRRQAMSKVKIENHEEQIRNTGETQGQGNRHRSALTSMDENRQSLGNNTGFNTNLTIKGIEILVSRPTL